MWTVKIDGRDVLYNPLLTDDGLALTEATLDLTIDGAGEANIGIPPSNPYSDTIRKMRSIISFEQDGTEICRGRVINDERDFLKIHHMSLEGELAFLIDNIMPPYDTTMTVQQFFATVIARYSEQVEAIKRLTVGQVTVTGSRRFYNINYSTIQDTLYNELLSVYGGHFRIRLENGTRYIDYLQSYDHVCSQVIRFSENLIDITDCISAEDLCTVVIPLGKMQTNSQGVETGRVNIRSINNNHEYVNDPESQLWFGNIWKIVIFENVTDQQELMALGQAYLDDNKAAASSIEISAIDLHVLDVDVERIMLGDLVRVVSQAHGVDDYYQCVEIHADLLNPQNNRYVFGKQRKTLTGMQTELSSRVTTVAEGTESIPNIWTQINNLDRRVTALEGG